MILPLRSRYRRVPWCVYSRVRVDGCIRGVRFVRLRYEGRCGASLWEVERVLRRGLPVGARWHSAGLAAGWYGSNLEREGRAQEVRVRDEGGDGKERARLEKYLDVWTDVLVDLGAVREIVVIDVKDGSLDIMGRCPRVLACSGGVGESVERRKWDLGWGGPFGYAYDCEIGMLVAPVVRWRGGERLLVDVGCEREFVIVRGVLRRVVVVDGEEGNVRRIMEER